MISKKNCMNLIIKEFSGFQEKWNKHLDYWEDDERGLCIDISEFSEYAAELIASRRLDLLPKIFNFIEVLMTEGDQDVQNAAATCFLEHLINITPEKISTDSFIPLLGTESRAYCKAWDEFTEVQTVGL